MTRYPQYQQKALGLAFILAPLCLVIGAAVYLLGIERSPDGTSSWVEGIFMAFGLVIMGPVNIELARRLGQFAPRYAIFCAIAATFVVFGLVPAVARIWQQDLILAGLNESVWKVGMQHPGWIPVILVGMAFGLFSSTFLGIGFLVKGGIPRTSAILLALAPIFLVIGQGGDDTIAWWQVNLFYPLACILWLVALAPLGLRYLSGNVETTRPAPSPVAA